MSDQTYKQELARDRNQAWNSHRDLRKIKEDMTLKGTLSLAGFLEITDIFFVFGLAGAILKDILDLTLLGSIPVIGTVLTFMASGIIAAGMLITGSRKYKKKASGIASIMKNKWGILGAGTIFEFLFGLNFFPIETVTLLIIIHLTLSQRREAAEVKQEEMTMETKDYG